MDDNAEEMAARARRRRLIQDGREEEGTLSQRGRGDAIFDPKIENTSAARPRDPTSLSLFLSPLLPIPSPLP